MVSTIYQVPDHKRSIGQNMFRFHLPNDEQVYSVVKLDYLDYDLLEQVLDPRLSEDDQKDAQRIMFIELVSQLDKSAARKVKKLPILGVQDLVEAWMSDSKATLGKSKASGSSAKNTKRR